MNKEKIIHLLKHDIKIEIQNTKIFINFFLNDLEDNKINQEEIDKSLNILKETFKNIIEQINLL